MDEDKPIIKKEIHDSVLERHYMSEQSRKNLKDFVENLNKLPDDVLIQF